MFVEQSSKWEKRETFCNFQETICARKFYLHIQFQEYTAEVGTGTQKLLIKDQTSKTEADNAFHISKWTAVMLSEI